MRVLIRWDLGTRTRKGIRASRVAHFGTGFCIEPWSLIAFLAAILSFCGFWRISRQPILQGEHTIFMVR